MGDDILTDQVPIAAEDLPGAGLKSPHSTVCLWAMLIARIYEVFPLFVTNVAAS